ncbi:Sapep family Mn(2+)-dependent dipeptidase, partial [Fusobacterium varium]
MDLQKKVLDYKEEVIKGIQGAVQIKSVQEPAKEGKPFGDGPAEALQYFLNLGKELGFEVKNFDNYAGTIEFGEGEETVGILGHVDVVPEGEGWTYPPYSATIADGKIFGRGTLDDKGPSMVCLYAMKAIKDSGIKLSRKIRMIIGAHEETGSLCMEHSFNTVKLPQPGVAGAAGWCGG